jgi:hypothetical protein
LMLFENKKIIIPNRDRLSKYFKDIDWKNSRSSSSHEAIFI